jgi:leucyl aminopeptidase
MMQLKSASKGASGEARIALLPKPKNQRSGSGTFPTSQDWSKAQRDAAQAAFKNEQDQLFFPDAKTPMLAAQCAAFGTDKPSPAALEQARCLGAECSEVLNRYGIAGATLDTGSASAETAVAAFAEGMALGNYQFRKYLSSSEGQNSLRQLKVPSSLLSRKALTELQGLIAATCAARDLVNEPLSYLTAPQLAKEIKSLGKKTGFSVRVLNKAQIVKMGMGGLLAVNKGSVDPPTFSIMEWKPSRAKNKKPIVLVGKGVVYDTGGLSLKPTKNSMDFMKADMGGAAAVIGAMHAVAGNKLPLHVVGLVPASDNRPGGNAYAPGDVVTMFSGKTVEVLNTDAEGRMLLADALHYAKRYTPELVIDLATLTGAAAMAIGPLGMVGMGTASAETAEALEAAGLAVHERIARFPFWSEFGDDIKSDIADIKNVGGSFGGAITAGKFLEHFTDFLHGNNAYRTRGGTGVGVRLLYQFLKQRAS